MQRMSSKDHLADFAHNAVSSLRRLVSYDSLTATQQDLVATSKAIEEQWLKKKTVINVTVVELWVLSFSDEVQFQITTLGSAAAVAWGQEILLKSDAARSSEVNSRKTIGEAALLSCFDALRILCRISSGDTLTLVQHQQLMSLFVVYFVGVPLSKRVREALSSLLVDLLSEYPMLMDDEFVILVYRILFPRDVHASRTTQLQPIVTSPLKKTAGRRMQEESPTEAQQEGGDAADDGTAKDGSNKPVPSSTASQGPQGAPSSLKVDGGNMEPERMHLVIVLINVFQRADAVCVNGVEDARVRFGTQGVVYALVNGSHNLLVSGANGRSDLHENGLHSSDDSMDITAGIVYLGLLGGLVRGCQSNKACVAQRTVRDAFLASWTSATACLSRMTASITISSPSAGRFNVVPIDGMVVWQSNLAELMVEVITDDSFSLRRQTLYADATSEDAGSAIISPSNASPATHLSSSQAVAPSLSSPHGSPQSVQGAADAASPSSKYGGCFELPQSPSGRQMGTPMRYTGTTLFSRTPPGSPAVAAVLFNNARRYEHLPPNWDSLVTSGSPTLWRLATLLSQCVLLQDRLDIALRALLTIDVANPQSDTVYRFLVSALLLLVTSNPLNAETLARCGAYPTLLALLTAPLGGAFPREVKFGTLTITPAQEVKANSWFLTVSLFITLGTSFLTPQTVKTLANAVDFIRASDENSTFQLDGDVVGSILYMLESATFPQNTVFFSGMSNVICKVDKFVGRWNGYTFCGWVHPLCVWLEGSLLFSFHEASTDSAVAVLLVANGRASSLALRVQNSKELSMSVIPDTSLPSDRWSHIAVLHSTSGFTVFINGRKTDNNATVPFPKEPSKKNRLELCFGGRPGLPSFVGAVACAEILESTLSEKDVERLYLAGPQSTATIDPPLSVSPLLQIRSKEEADGVMRVDVCGSLVGKHEGVSVGGVIPFRVMDVRTTFEQLGIVDWALNALQRVHLSKHFATAAQMYLEFLRAHVKLTRSVAALNELLEHRVLERLGATVLQWGDVPVEVPGILLSMAAPQGSTKILRDHPISDQIFDLIINLMESNDVSSLTLSALLRELSDCLAVPENAKLFRRVHGRFTRILSITHTIPHECIEYFVILAEKLCKEQREMEKVLRYLLFEPPAQTSEVVKCELLRMLYDTARPNVAMCDLIGGAFNGNGLSCLIMLACGAAHRSEAIRVYSLRLLAFMLHTNRKFRDTFVKVHGFDVLAFCMSSPRTGGNTVPVKLTTFNCLFQIALDYFQPTKEDEPLPSRLHSRTHTKGHRKHSGSSSASASGSKYQDPTRSGIGVSLGLQGHLPGLVKNRLRAVRREYSFDVSVMDCTNVDARLMADDSYNATGVQNILHTPQGIQLTLAMVEIVLASSSMSALHRSGASPLLRGSGSLGGGAAGSPVASHDARHRRMGSSMSEFDAVLTSNSREVTMGASTIADVDSKKAGGAGEATLSSGSHDGRHAASNTDGLSTMSAASPRDEDSAELVVKRVLGYLEKIVDVSRNAETLAPYAWLEWLWSAVKPILASSRGCMGSLSGGAAPATPSVGSGATGYEGNGTSHKYSKRFVNAVLTSTRNIIRKVVLVEITCNPKASVVRRIHSLYYEPALVRIIVEEVTRHFSKGNRREMANTQTASNVIRNLDVLFSCVSDVLEPMSLTLGVEIVTSISAIAISNNSSVRSYMKSHSKLFDTRSRLAFLLVTSTERFSVCDYGILEELIEANSHNLAVMAYIVRRLVYAIQAANMDETEVLMSMTRQLADIDEDQRKVLSRAIGSENVEFLHLILGTGESAYRSSRTRSNNSSMHDLHGSTQSSAWDSRSNRSGSDNGAMLSEDKNVRPVHTNEVSTLVEWGAADATRWSGILQRIERATRSVDSEIRSIADKREKERISMHKDLRKHEERTSTLQLQVATEFDRIRQEVAELDTSTNKMLR